MEPGGVLHQVLPPARHRRAAQRLRLPLYQGSSWSAELIKRFRPFVGRKGNTNEQALALAAYFIHVVAKCFTNQEEILKVTIDEAMHRRD